MKHKEIFNSIQESITEETEASQYEEEEKRDSS